MNPEGLVGAKGGAWERGYPANEGRSLSPLRRQKLDFSLERRVLVLAKIVKHDKIW